MDNVDVPEKYSRSLGIALGRGAAETLRLQDRQSLQESPVNGCQLSPERISATEETKNEERAARSLWACATDGSCACRSLTRPRDTRTLRCGIGRSARLVYSLFQRETAPGRSDRFWGQADPRERIHISGSCRRRRRIFPSWFASAQDHRHSQVVGT